MICDRKTDRLTEGRTDRRTPGKNKMSPDPEGGGGDIIIANNGPFCKRIENDKGNVRESELWEKQ